SSANTPVNTTPGNQVATEDTPLVINGLSIADNNDLSLASYTITVSGGTLLLNELVGGGVIAGEIAGNGTSTITITGATIAAINATLADANGLTFTPAADSTATVTLTIVAN